MNYNDLLMQANMVSTVQHERITQREKLRERVDELGEEITKMQKDLENYICACAMVGDVSDSITQETLNCITGVINKALGVLFPKDSRTISIVKKLHAKTYPHFVVELHTSTGATRTFKQSGTGLAQVISVLFTLCLIDARGGRKVVAMDELLSGLHPDAKKIVSELILALSDRFQFIMVEYGLDLGKQYEAVMNKGTATFSEYTEAGGYYYNHFVKKELENT